MYKNSFENAGTAWWIAWRPTEERCQIARNEAGSSEGTKKEFIQVPCFPTLSLLSSFWDHISKWTVVETSILLPPYSWYVYSMPASIAGGRWKIFLSHKTNNKRKIKIKNKQNTGKAAWLFYLNVNLFTLSKTLRIILLIR